MGMTAQQRVPRPYELGYNQRSRGSELLHSLREKTRERGPIGALPALGQFAVCSAAYSMLHRRRTFRSGGQDFPYLKQTTTTERCVEVPWVMAHIARAGMSGDQILEVGNVLGQYMELPHTIVDKYELDPRVSNIDIVDYRPAHRFPLVVSISTLEHVGFDEAEREGGKFLRALRTIQKSCLAEAGKMLLTLPLGYNPEIDELVVTNATELGTVRLLQRTSSLNFWGDVDPSIVASDPSRFAYGGRYAGATVVALSEYTSPGD